MSHKLIHGLKLLAMGIGTAMCLALIAYVLTVGALRDSKVILAFAAVMVIIPISVYAALKRPILFPVCLFVMFVPFDQLLGLSKFGTLTRLLALISGVAIVFWLIRNKVGLSPSRSLLTWSALFFWMLCTAFWAIDPNLALGRALTFSQLLVLYAALSTMPVEVKDLKAVLSSAVIGGAVAGAYGGWFFYHNLSNIMRRLQLSLNGGQDVIDPNHFGAALILPITIVTVFALTSRSMIAKIALFVIDLVLFAGVYASGSRGTFVALAVVFAYLMWASRERAQLGFVASIAIAIGLFMPTSIWARFQTAISSGGAGRTDIWHVGFGAFKHFWLVGAGLDNFPLAFNTAYLQVFTHGAGWARGSHNLVVATGVELGAIGLILMLAAWGTQYAMLNTIPRRSDLFNYRMISQASVLGLFVAAMFLDVMYTKYTWLTFIIGSMTYSIWRIRQQSINLRMVAPTHNVTAINGQSIAPQSLSRPQGVRSTP